MNKSMKSKYDVMLAKVAKTEADLVARCEAHHKTIQQRDALREALQGLTKEIELGKLNIRKDFGLINAHNCALKALFLCEK